MISTEECFRDSYKVDVPAGADSVVEADPALVVRVLASCQDVLVAFVVGSLIDHPGAAFHPGRVAPAQVGVKVRAVSVTLITGTLVVAVLVEDNLDESCTDKFTLTRHFKWLQNHRKCTLKKMTGGLYLTNKWFTRHWKLKNIFKKTKHLSPVNFRRHYSLDPSWNLLCTSLSALTWMPVLCFGTSNVWWFSFIPPF